MKASDIDTRKRVLGFINLRFGAGAGERDSIHTLIKRAVGLGGGLEERLLTMARHYETTGRAFRLAARAARGEEDLEKLLKVDIADPAPRFQCMAASFARPDKLGDAECRWEVWHPLPGSNGQWTMLSGTAPTFARARELADEAMAVCLERISGSSAR